ncbi:MAG: pimeloyl-ACP methyl ester esterase BioH [Parashewanella sp.]
MTHSELHIESFGQGTDLVLLHGWGMNSAVFRPIASHFHGFRVHLVDLPGFGHSQPLEGELQSWVDHLSEQLPDNAIWLGWSLGGLIATQVALTYPKKMSALITIASSPYFIANEQQNWPGIMPKVLAAFASQLKLDVKTTIERFLAIQALGSPHAKQDISLLKRNVLSKPLPSRQALVQGLEFLEQIDLRNQLKKIELPWLRIWGRLDGLVPKTLPPLMPVHHNEVTDIMLPKASHAPFISHPDEFLAALLPWLKARK